MKGIKPSELKDKSVEELEAMVSAERAGLYQTRRDLVFRKIMDGSSIKVRRHNIARMLTLVSQKQKEAK